MAADEAERERLIAELKTHGGADLIKRAAGGMTLAQLRDLVLAAREQVAFYEKLGFVDEAAASR